MSAEMMIEVLRQSKTSHSSKLVLLAISAYAEDFGVPVSVSYTTLDADSGVSHRGVLNCIRELEATGYVYVHRQQIDGQRQRNFYTVLRPWLDRSDEQQRIHRKSHTNYARTFVAVGRRDGFHCQHCRSTVDLEIDHIIPVIKGGTNDLPNLQLLCQLCNGKKGTL